ncbi:MAG: 50S ribosomal protein L30e [Candidatus Diapherotrites archaeon]
MASADFLRELRRAVDSGKVVFGKRQSEKSILKGNAQIIVLSANAPILLKEKISSAAEISGIPLEEYTGTALELGSLCGKPFSITVMAVEDAGKSGLMAALKKKEEKHAKGKTAARHSAKKAKGKAR